MKEFEVKYGKDVYKRNALKNEDLIYLGTRLAPKVVSLGSVISCVMGDKFAQGENIYSFHKVLSDIFDAEDWKWLIDKLLYSDDALALNGAYLSREELDEHFAGDFIKLYTIVLRFAYLNLGEFKPLIENLSGLAGNIAGYLQKIVEIQSQNLETSFGKYVKQNQGKNAGKKPKDI